MGLLNSLRSGAGKINSLLYPGMLTGTDPQAAQAAASQAMMQMGAGLLGGANFGQAYGAGSVAGGNVLENVQRQALFDRMRGKEQRDEEAARRQQETEMRAKQIAAPYIAKGDYQGARDALMQAGLWQQAEAPAKYVPPEPKAPGLPTGLKYDESGRIVPIPEYEEQQARLAEIRRQPAPSVTVNMPPAQGAFDKAMGDKLADEFVTLNKGMVAAKGKLAKLQEVKALTEGLNTGKLAPSMAKVSALADYFGLKLDTKLDQKQALDALAKQFALELRNPQGGAGMPGALSDKDREFLVASVPGLDKTPGGNAMIIEIMTRLAQREIDVAKFANQYVQQRGMLDPGFYQGLAEWSAQNPLFDGITGSTGPRRRVFNPETGRIE